MFTYLLEQITNGSIFLWNNLVRKRGGPSSQKSITVPLNIPDTSLTGTVRLHGARPITIHL
jgi:hypothetical protein